MFDPIFGPFFWGKLLSFTGIWVHSVVAAIITFDLTGSALAVGAVTAAQFAPQPLLALASGKLADRGNPVLQVVVGRIMVGLGSGALAVWILVVGGVDGLSGAIPVGGSSLLVGLGLVVGGPAMQAIVPSMIRSGEMTAAMALESVPMTVARAGGPVLGVAVATQANAATAFAIAAVCNVTFGVIVMALRLPRPRPPEEGADLSVGAALRHVREDAPLLALLIGIAAVGVGVDPSLTLAPALASRLDGGSSLVGWLSSGFGIGAGLGFVVFAPLVRRVGLASLSGSGLLLIALGLAAAALSWTPALAVTAFGVSGVGMTLAFSSITTQIQTRSPDALRGRIMALWFIGFLGARPVAAGLGGSVADRVGVGAALAVVGVVVTTAAYVCRPSRLSAVPPD